MSKNNRNDSGMGCLIPLITAVLAMPVVGVFLICAGDSEEKKYLGTALLIVSIILYLKIEMH